MEVQKARALEMKYFEDQEVYTKVPREKSTAQMSKLLALTGLM